PTTDPEDDEGTAGVQTTSSRSYNGFAPYHLSIVSERSEDDPMDDSFTNGSEDDEEYAEGPAEGDEESEG
ncbi:MAG: hypothetical protein GX921_07120, partial [Bacteroidales bacterium]|nr:hypothetical protein [Bacteroidales bacterium]